MTGILLLTIIALLVPTRVVGQYSLSFGGPRRVVEVANPPLPPELKQLTVEFRFKTSAPVRKPMHLVSRWEHDAKAPDRGTFYVGFSSATRVVFGIRNEDGHVESIAGRSPGRDGKWHHVAAVWDGTKMAIHLDGRVVAEHEVTDFGALNPSKLPLLIGPAAVRKERQPPIFEGFLGDVCLWSEALDAASIRASMRGSARDGETGLCACYSLRARRPRDTLEDSAGSGAAGRLSENLARAGWCHTRTWDDTDPGGIDLFCYDLHARAGETDRITGECRTILVANEKRQQVGVLWQEANAGAIRITWINPSSEKHRTIELRSRTDKGEGGILAAGTTDPQGNLYYLVIQTAPRNRPEDSALGAALHKADAGGKPLAERAIDTTRQAFNIWSFGRRGGNLRHSRGHLGLILPRTMYRSRDGLRHQGAIAVVFSAKSLEVLRHLGTTSSHSMGNILTVNSKGEFVGVDLGDNYPRGVHLHKFTAAGKVSRVVFTFKTAHGTRPRNQSPVYREISNPGRTFYKWSNDNATYTELGGVSEDRKSYTIIFATDQSLDGRVLDNSRAFRHCGDPRNLAMVRVIKNFQRAPAGNEVSDAIMVRIPKGTEPETGGFFNFAGRWTPQRVTGVIWLTRYKENEAAHAPQVIQLSRGGTLVLWEKRGLDGSSLQAIRIDRRGTVGAPIRLPIPVELNRHDRLLRLGKRIYLLASEPGGSRTRLYFIRDDG